MATLEQVTTKTVTKKKKIKITSDYCFQRAAEALTSDAPNPAAGAAVYIGGEHVSGGGTTVAKEWRELGLALIAARKL